MFLEHLHQARFANPRLAAEEHDLSDPSDLCPTLHQEPDFLLPAHQWSPPGAGGFQATAGHTLTEHAVDCQRLGDTLQGRRA